jgi:DNA topoisomerase-1
VEGDKGPLKPTELGFIVSDLLAASFPRIMNVEFTAGMENSLDEIEEGKIRWRDVLRQFYDPFDQDVATAASAMLSVKKDGLKTDQICDKCGAAWF